MNQAEAFAAITVAAVASDRSFVDAEARLIHSDRKVTAGEAGFLEQLGATLGIPPERSRQIIEVCALLNADCLA
jgi:hypothetical protein